MSAPDAPGGHASTKSVHPGIWLSAFILGRPGGLHEVASELPWAALGAPLAVEVAEAAAWIAAQGRSVDAVAVIDRLRDVGSLDRLGGPEAVLDLAQQQAHPSQLRHYVDRCRAAYSLDQTRAALGALVQAADSVPPDPSAVADLGELIGSSLVELAGDRGTSAGKPGTYDKALESRIRELEEANRLGLSPALPTGMSDLDKMLSGGLRPGNLVVMGAGTSIGKSLFAQQVLEGLGGPGADSDPPTVADFTLEMTRHEMADRTFATEVGSKYDEIRQRGADRDQADSLRRIAEKRKLRSSRIHVIDDAGISVSRLASTARALAVKVGGLDLILVDYLQLVAGPRSPTREREVASVSRELKKLAGALECPVIAVSQLNREFEKAKRPPTKSDLRESGAIEQDADIVILLHRPEWQAGDKAGRRVEVLIEKQRGGAVGSIPMTWDPEFIRFEVDRQFSPFEDPGGVRTETV